MSKIACDIVHLGDRVYLGDDVAMVVVPGKLGSMGFMEGHVPMLAKLTDGAVRVHLQDDSVKTFATQGGYAHCTGNKVFILADRAISVEDIDEKEVDAQAAELQERMNAMEEGIKRKVLARKLRWCDLQKKVKAEAGSSL